MNFKKSMENLGRQVFLLRQKHQISIDELACKIKKKRIKIEKLEMGSLDIDIETIKRVSRYFNCEIKIKLDSLQ